MGRPIANIHTQVSVSVVEHCCKCDGAQDVMLTLISGSQIGQSDKGREAKRKLCNLLLTHICYHLREPGDEVCACVCLQ